LSGTAYTFGLVALDDTTLVAEHAGQFIRSTDAGCTWTAIGDAPTAPMTLATGGGHVYAWPDNGTELVRIDGALDAIDANDIVVTTLTPPPGSIHGLAASGEDVVIGMDAVIHKSTDAGATFDRGTTPVVAGDASGLLHYRTAFDPNDLAHAIVGTAVTGAFVTFDGGETWTRATGTSTVVDGNSNVFNAVVSPADANVVWAQGIDLATDGRHVFRSQDGGLTYDIVVTESADVTLVNGPIMAAHPSKAGVLYFVFGTFFQGAGTDIYRYDTATELVTKTHNPFDDVGSIVFSPADEDLMYLGLVTEEID
jgi:hypothetical protein